MSVLNITKNNFQEEVMNSNKPVSYTHLLQQRQRFMQLLMRWLQVAYVLL